MRSKHTMSTAALSLLLGFGCGSNGGGMQTATKKPSPGSGTTAAPKTTGEAPGASGDTASGASGGAAGAGSMASVGGTAAAPADPRGNCNINSGFPDDNACLVPPSPDEGMQIHVGPSDYNDMAQINQFIFHPGEERSECWTFHTPNADKVQYQTFVLSGRAGTHHIINTMYSVELTDGGFTMCGDGGTGTNPNIIDNLPDASKAFMPLGTVAPENADIGRAIPPNTPSQADMHYFNFTQTDILREFWMNIYYAPAGQVKQEAIQIRGMGGFSWSFSPIQPGTDKVYSYSCPITADGRILSLLGHYHSHGKQFTASVKHANGQIDKVFEMYDYLDPANFQYDTITTNPDFSSSAAGAVSGSLDVVAGDTMLWDCHIINDSMTGLTYTNAVKTGEMCNLWGSSIGPKINCLLQ